MKIDVAVKFCLWYVDEYLNIAIGITSHPKSQELLAFKNRTGDEKGMQALFNYYINNIL